MAFKIAKRGAIAPFIVMDVMEAARMAEAVVSGVRGSLSLNIWISLSEGG